MCWSHCRTNEPIKIRFTVWTRGAGLVEPCFAWGSRSPHGNGHFGGVEIFPYVVYQCSDWPAAAAVSCHVNPPPHKIPTLLTRCGLSSKLSVHSFSLLLLLLPVSNYSAIFRTLCLQQFYFDPPGITVFSKALTFAG